MFKKIWNWIKGRSVEGSTYAGAAAITYGAGQIFKIDEAPGIADAITDSAPTLMANPVVGIITLVAGIAAVFEQKHRKD